MNRKEITVRDIRILFDDCWVDVKGINNEGEERVIFSESISHTPIPDEFLNLKVEFCCCQEVNHPNRPDLTCSCVVCYIEEEF